MWLVPIAPIKEEMLQRCHYYQTLLLFQLHWHFIKEIKAIFTRYDIYWTSVS